MFIGKLCILHVSFTESVKAFTTEITERAEKISQRESLDKLWLGNCTAEGNIFGRKHY